MKKKKKKPETRSNQVASIDSKGKESKVSKQSKVSTCKRERERERGHVILAEHEKRHIPFEPLIVQAFRTHLLGCKWLKYSPRAREGCWE